MHKPVTRYTASLHNVPLLITEVAFLEVLEYLAARNSGEIEASSNPVKNQLSEVSYNPDTKIGMIDVSGALSYRPIQTLCGVNASYQQMTADFEAMVKAGAEKIILMVNSGGGEAYGCFEQAAYIRKLADENNVKILAYNDGNSASAAYAFSAVAHEYIVNPDAETGSIGVVIRLMNDSEALKKAGLERTFVHAGESKIPFDSEGKFSKSFIEDLQAKVDSTYMKFVDHVASYRQISKDAVIGTKAKMLSAEEALKIGIVDRVMTRLEFSEYLADMVIGNKKTTTSVVTKKLESEEVTKEELSAVEAAYEAKLLAKEQEMQTVVEDNAKLSAMVSELQAKFEAAEQAQKEQKAEMRFKELSSVVGDNSAKELMAIAEHLSDAQFAILKQNMTKSVEVESKSEMFTETGTIEKTREKAELGSTEAEILRKKYANK